MAVKIQLRRGTASAWSTANPTLAEGEIGLEIGASPIKFKVGDGATAWNSLGYFYPDATRKQALYFYIDGTLTTSLKAIFIAPFALTITNIKAAVVTAPTGADLILDIHKNGTTIFTTQGNRPTIPAGETADSSSVPDVISLAAGDIVRLEIDQIGSTIAGADLSVTIVCEEA